MNTQGRDPRRSATDGAARGETRLVCRLLPGLAGLLLFSGCQSLLSPGPDDESYKAMTDTSGILGPLGRMLQPGRDESGISAGVARELDALRDLFDDGRYDQALAGAKRIARSEKDSAAGEEAQFMVAECQFELQRYAAAQDSYDQLIEDYPSTRYIDAATRRLFETARIWLRAPAPARSEGDIKLASHTEEQPVPAPQLSDSKDPTIKIPILPNFHDRSRPVFDTQGRALGALKSIWLNDPTGPLADDALMMTASYYLRKGDNVEADRYYKILREEYPKSPHLENAFLLGSHVKLMSYQGALYEGTTLNDARKLKESTLRLFPDSPERQRLREELQDVYDAQAQRDWARVEYFRRKNKPRAMAIYCQQLVNNYPESEYAQKARQVLSEIGPDITSGLPGFDNPQPAPRERGDG